MSDTVVQLANWSTIIGGVLGALFGLSEYLGWSKCKPNSVSEYLYFTFCRCLQKEQVNTVSTATQTIVEIPTRVIDPSLA